MRVLANDPKRTTNAQAVADLAHLGILRADDDTLDLTIGPRAGFWTTWRPQQLTTNDANTHDAKGRPIVADHHRDACDTEDAADLFDVVVWDPPYGYRGTSALASDSNYGIARPYTTPDAIDQLLYDGTVAALTLARRLALVKCQDQNVASAFREQSRVPVDAAKACGAEVVAKLYVAAYRSQPAGKPQLNVWGCHSVLLVLA